MGSKTPVKGFREIPIDLVGSRNTVTVFKSGTLSVDDIDGAIRTTSDTTRDHIFVDGTVILLANSVAINLDAERSIVDIGASGRVIGLGGISMLGSHNKVENAGLIRADQLNGVYLQGSDGDAPTNSVVNSGRIFGAGGVVMGGGGEVINAAGGKITGSLAAVAFSYGTGTLINNGLITGGDTAVRGAGDYDMHIVNHGRIVGNILMESNGNDVVDTRGGTIDGEIRLGLGNDTLVTDRANIKLTETNSGGVDIVKSTVSYILNDYVEQLTLIGKKNINGTGTANGSDFLYGNAGNNILDGKNGYNEIFGYGGNDKLIGGTDSDVFGFGKGYDRDTIANFGEQDYIAMEKFGITNFDRLQSHIKQHGDDVWINMGKGDLLIVKDTLVETFDGGDFFFNYNM